MSLKLNTFWKSVLFCIIALIIESFGLMFLGYGSILSFILVGLFSRLGWSEHHSASFIEKLALTVLALSCVLIYLLYSNMLLSGILRYLVWFMLYGMHLLSWGFGYFLAWLMSEVPKNYFQHNDLKV